MESNKTLHSRITLAGLIVTVGIVFGDIGTSPLYVMKAITGVNPGYDADYILGAVSCVIWTLTLQTTLKYVVLALRADNKGEGGILALFALLRKLPWKWPGIAAAVGAAALIADGMITPAVTVTSAIEGIRLVAPTVSVIPIVLAVIVIIFAMQRAGTGMIGRFFGPFMLLWFLSLGVLGCFAMVHCPSVLRAFNPWYAVRLMFSSPEWFLILGAVFLCTTGAEALYSDLGHCGRRNITVSWIFVKVMLILNYLGQGAWLIAHEGEPIGGINPFYAIIPHSLTIVGVVMATLAAVIASQALLSGSFTIFSEAVQLDFWPKLKVKYPSDEKGQLYIPSVNWALLAGCLVTVLMFRDSSHMEAAYGLAITVTMLMTTLLLTLWMRMRGVSYWLCGLFCTFFMLIEGLFFAANMVKFAHGGWYTLIAAGAVAAVMVIWNKATAVRSRYVDFKPLSDNSALISSVKSDGDIPKYASNLIYLNRSSHPGMIESKVLYSIINKHPKRADHYWFVHIDIDDAPDTLEYRADVVVPESIYVVSMRLGFRVPAKVSVYFRQIVEDLVAAGKLDLRSGYPSLRSKGIAGDFRFVMLHRVYSPSTNCRGREAFLLRAHAMLRRMALSDQDAYGLDTSVVVSETVPLIINTAAPRRIRPAALGRES